MKVKFLRRTYLAHPDAAHLDAAKVYHVTLGTAIVNLTSLARFTTWPHYIKSRSNLLFPRIEHSTLHKNQSPVLAESRTDDSSAESQRAGVCAGPRWRFFALGVGGRCGKRFPFRRPASLFGTRVTPRERRAITLLRCCPPSFRGDPPLGRFTGTTRNVGYARPPQAG